jgi:hypothetical protein
MREFAQIEKSYELGWAGLLALQLALTRRRKKIRLEEYLAGIYLINREALSSYWLESDRLDGFVRGACGLTEPIWLYWIQIHDAMKGSLAEGAGLQYSEEAAKVLNDAARFAHGARKRSTKKPELRIEHVLAALTVHQEIEFARRLVASGLKTAFLVVR